MPLFEVSASPCGNRTKLHGESAYAYYRDSERPGMIAVRDLLNGWFEEVPTSEQLDLQKRFQSRIKRQHRSAFFELFLHHFLLRCGFQVEFHPDMDGVATIRTFWSSGTEHRSSI